MHSVQPASSVFPAPETIPSNLFKPTAPHKAKVLDIYRLTDPESANDVKHIVLDIRGSGYRYVEGQSAGILPPGVDANGKPHKLRLYSIASSAIGDDGQGNTLTLCVKRAVTQLETGEVFYGVCSSFLCDLKPGDTVDLTGPVGKGFLMPNDPSANLIMVATGTGVAPFRAFLHRRYKQGNAGSGQSWFFFGAQTRKDYLYGEEMDSYKGNSGYHLVTAFSREEKNPEGGRMYVQHRLYEHRETIFDLLLKPNTYFYMCGLRGMEPGILDGLRDAATAVGHDWDELLARIKAEKRWMVEVY